MSNITETQWEAEVARLRKGIQDYLDGNYGRNIPTKVDQCKHGLFKWESCENCIDDYFFALLAHRDEDDK